MKLNEMYIYVKQIGMMNLIGMKTTKHQVAVCSTIGKSRSTVYRDLNKMEEMGLIVSVWNEGIEVREVEVTDKGEKFQNDFREIKQ